MKTDNWKLISEILPDCLEMEITERQNYLDELRLSPEVRRELETYLELETETENFMSATADNLTGEFFSPSEDSGDIMVGQKIGIYKIEKEIGGGGMGTVYLATRTDGKFEQKVALKMLRREFNNDNIRRYFRRESEIQAKLENPFIARILDVGTTGDGIPFIVLEYVEGVAVDKFCAENDLSLKERLKLFNKICQAVAHAHRNLIVHRDLKPSNILVNRDGEPKLLDFGISKLLGNEIIDKTTLTALGAMTPEYASPEQIKGETVSTATDIYSLGVILYKMLTGHLPYDLKDKRNGEILKTVVEQEPVKPSIISGSNFQVSSSDKQNPQSATCNPQLKGDLDNIILKALAKESERRYKTVEEFSADIWRHLDGLPVSARPANLSYRASKFFRRNKISAIAAALILLSLIGGTTVALWQAREARAQAYLAIDSQKKSDDEREKAEKISRFMFRVFGYANPAWFAEGAKTGGNTRVIEAMEDLSGQIDVEFTGQADVQSELHHKFAESFSWTANYEKDPTRKEYLQQKALFHSLHGFELRKQFYGEWHELVAKDLYYNFGSFGKTDAEHAAVLMKAIEMMRSTNPNNLNLPYMLQDYSARLIRPDFSEKHEAYRNAVMPTTDESKYQIAENFLREAMPIFRHHYRENNLAVYHAECSLSYVLAIQEKWTDFDEHFIVCQNGETNFSDSKQNPLNLIRTILAEKEVSR